MEGRVQRQNSSRWLTQVMEWWSGEGLGGGRRSSEKSKESMREKRKESMREKSKESMREDRTGQDRTGERRQDTGGEARRWK